MEQNVPKRRRIKFRLRGITQKKAYKDLLKAYNESSIDERDDALSSTTSGTWTLEPNIMAV